MRILVVEDEPDMNRLIIKTLKKEGYSADGCQNGEDALVYLAGAEYDTILLDVMMPKLDGFSLLQKIRHQGMDVPVLMLTARDAVSDRVKGLDYGADDYLVKPFDFDELTARIRAMTRRQAGSRSNQLSIADLTIDIRKKTASRGQRHTDDSHYGPGAVFDQALECDFVENIHRRATWRLSRTTCPSAIVMIRSAWRAIFSSWVTRIRVW